MSTDQIIMIIATSVTGLATVAIAVFAWVNNKAINTIQKENLKIYLALISANLSNPHKVSFDAQKMQEYYTTQYEFILNDLSISDPRK